MSRPTNAINHLPLTPLYAKWGWRAAMTLRQYLVCRESRKVAQHCVIAMLSDCPWDDTRNCATVQLVQHLNF
jgi:hypothetical protein